MIIPSLALAIYFNGKKCTSTFAPETLFLLSVQFHAQSSQFARLCMYGKGIKLTAQLMCVTCAPLHIINTAQDVFDLQPGGSEFIVFMCARTRASRRPSRK
jgi:hypothetical protein